MCIVQYAMILHSEVGIESNKYTKYYVYRLEQELVLVMDLIHHHWICSLVQVLSHKHLDVIVSYFNIAAERQL